MIVIVSSKERADFKDTPNNNSVEAEDGKDDSKDEDENIDVNSGEATDDGDEAKGKAKEAEEVEEVEEVEESRSLRGIYCLRASLIEVESKAFMIPMVW